MSAAPRLLVSGVVLGQPMGGVRRHNAELLPRLAERLRAAGGGLGVLEGAVPIPFELPDVVERIPSNVPFQPPHMRALAESRALREALAAAAAAGRPFDLVHTAHLPAPRSLGVPVTRTVHDLRSIDLERAPFVRRLIGGRVLRRAFEGARAVGVVSDWMATRVVEEWPNLEDASIIGNGADHLPLLRREPAGRASRASARRAAQGLEPVRASGTRAAVAGRPRGPRRRARAGRLRGIAAGSALRTARARHARRRPGPREAPRHGARRRLPRGSRASGSDRSKPCARADHGVPTSPLTARWPGRARSASGWATSTGSSTRSNGRSPRPRPPWSPGPGTGAPTPGSRCSRRPRAPPDQRIRSRP